MTDNALKWEDFPDVLKSLMFDEDSHDAEVLLLTCIDFRFFHKVVKHMEEAGLSKKYDQVIVGRNRSSATLRAAIRLH